MSHLKSHKTTGGDFLHFFLTLLGNVQTRIEVFSVKLISSQTHTRVPSFLPQFCQAASTQNISSLTLYSVSETPPLLYFLPEEHFIQESFSWSDRTLPFSLQTSRKEVQPLPNSSGFTTLVSSTSQSVVLSKIRHSRGWWGVSWAACVEHFE